MIKKIMIGCVIPLLLLTACGTTETQPLVNRVEIPATIPPSPSAIQLDRPSFVVLNSDKIKELNTKLTMNPDPNYVLYALDYDSLEKLMDDLDKIADYMEKRGYEVQYYRDLITKLQQLNDQHNTDNNNKK